MSRFEKDRELQRDVLEATAFHACSEGRLEEAIALWNQAKDQAEGEPEPLARALVGLANVHIRSGLVDRARPLLLQALDAARAANDRILEGRVLNNIGLVHAVYDEFEDAIRYFRQAIQVREDVGYTRGVAVNHHNIGDMHFIHGDLKRAYVSFQRSRDLAEDIGWTRGVAMNDVYLAYIDAVERRDLSGISRIDETILVARDLGDSEVALSGTWLSARLLARVGRADEARERLQRARDEAHELQLSHVESLISASLDELTS
jgi:tetratricopeptide (TPR) repeat protein